MSQDQQPIATPRTQQAWDNCKHRDFPDIARVMFAHSCTLERELVQKEQDLKSWQSMSKSVTEGFDKEIQSLQSELDARKVASELSIKRAATLIDELQSERDKLQREILTLQGCSGFRTRDEQKKVEEERDKLRKALEKLLEGHCEPDGSPDGGFSYCDQCKTIMEALNHSKSTTQ